MKVSIAIVAYNEQAYLPGLFQDLMAQDYPHEKIELLLIDSMSTDRTRALMEEFAARDNGFCRTLVLDNLGRNVPCGYNVALKHYIGDAITRIDGHASLSPDFISKSVAVLEGGEWVCGGMRPSRILRSSAWSSALLALERSPFGGSIAPYRMGRARHYVSSVFHGMYRREVYDRVGIYDEDLSRSEDNHMNWRIRKAGYRICYDPGIVSYQYARSSFRGIMRQKFLNGHWIGLTLGVCPGCVSLFHLAPFMFLLGSLVTGVLALLGAWQLAAVMWLVYAALNLTGAVVAAVSEKKSPYMLCMPVMFLLMHMSYGLGTLAGLVRLPLWRRRRTKRLKYRQKRLAGGENRQKRLAVVTTSAALPGEKGLNRMFYLAELLCRHGYAVDFITSDFQHWNKAHRAPDCLEHLDTPCRILLAHEPGYTKNVQVKRIFSHRALAKNIKKLLRQNTYDLVYCDIPDNYVAATAAKYARAGGIPFVVDVEDLWPEAMKMAFHVPVVSNVLFSYFSLDARRTYRRSNAVIGSSDTYRDTPLKYGCNIPLKETVYVGNDLAAFDRGVAENAPGLQKPEGEFWVTYAGTLGTSYDIPTLIRAVALLREQGHTGVRAMILGDGPLRDEFETLAKELEGDVTFAGYLPHGEMAAWLVRSDAVINSVVKAAPQSIVSKIGDYLAAGVPMINTCVDPEFWKKVEADGFGVNVQPEDAQALADTILRLKNDPRGCETMGRLARQIAVEQFDRPKAFEKIVAVVDRLLG